MPDAAAEHTKNVIGQHAFIWQLLDGTHQAPKRYGACRALPHGDCGMSAEDGARAPKVGWVISRWCKHCGNETEIRDRNIFTDDDPACMYCHRTDPNALNRFESCGLACRGCGENFDGLMIMDKQRREAICEGCRDMRLAEMRGK